MKFLELLYFKCRIILLTTIKKSEDGKSTICRCIEESLWLVQTGMRTIGIGFPSLIGEEGLLPL